MTHAPRRVLVLGDRGEDVRRLQVAVNARGRVGAKIRVDGAYGPKTRAAAFETAVTLGVASTTLRRGLTVGAQRIIRKPSVRTPQQLLRARVLAKARARAKARRPLRLKAYDRADVWLDRRVREVGGNNVGELVERIIRANGGVPGEAWCGDFVAVCYLEAGSKAVNRMWASTIWLLAKLVPVGSPLRGHIVVFDFGTPGAKHTGIFEQWVVVGHTFTTIEGNTGSGGARSDSADGSDGVFRRTRTIDQVAGFRRIPT